MAARVIHIGTDHCHRLPVLESAGYQVDGCSSVKELRLALRQSGSLEAVLVAENERAEHEDMLRELRERSVVPVVLFRESLWFSKETDGEAHFDLEVPVLQPPETWLTDLAALITRCRELRAQSREICNQAQQLRLESAAVREQSQRERQRSREVRKEIPQPQGFVRGPEDGEDD